MTRKKILIVAHFCDCPPEDTNNRFNYIAEGLASKHEVELITSSFSHRDKTSRATPTDELPYKITLIDEPPYRKNVSLRRLFHSHRSMARSLRKYLASHLTPDVIYCAVPSLDVAAVCAKFAKARGVPFYLDVQDLWPEAFSLAIRIPLLSKLFFLPMKRRANLIYRSAKHIFSVSDTYAKRASSVSDAPSSTVYLGTEISRFDKCAASTERITKDKDELLLVYLGTVGASYDLSLTVHALHVLGDRAPTLVILGNGPELDSVVRLANRLGVRLRLPGKLPYPEMCAVLCGCDIAINPIKKNAPQSIINKHADYAAAGLPVISTQNCQEYSQLLMEYGAGISVAEGNVLTLAEAIDKLTSDEALREEMGRASRRLAEERFDRRVAYAEIFNCLMN